MVLSNEEIRQWIEFACDSCQTPNLARKITFSFNNRVTSFVGKAKLREKSIVFATKYFSHPDFTEQDAINTVIHETCHIIAWEMYGEKLWVKKGSKTIFDAHGPRWKRLMVKCGIPADRCYDGVKIESSRKKSSRLWVVCECCERIIQVRKSNWQRYQECGDYKGANQCYGYLYTVNGNHKEYYLTQLAQDAKLRIEQNNLKAKRTV